MARPRENMTDGDESKKDVMDLAKVRELVKLVERSAISELEISQRGLTIRIQKAGVAAVSVGSQAANPGQAAVIPIPAPVEAPPPAAGPASTPSVDPARDKYREVRSPIVGTFYRAPSPDADPFVREGDRVRAGQTLCIIEAMKVMNEIEAEFPGVVREILVSNAQPVEAETTLFLVDPD
jgi:acetyl-CoA carboxylase biotin carboxyl carrier protein